MSAASTVTLGLAPRGRVIPARAATLLLAAALATGLCAAPAAGTTAGAGATTAISGGQVVVSVIIQSRITSTFDEGGVLIKSNTPWRVTADVPGDQRFELTGDSTSGYYVDLPDGAVAVEVCAR